MAAFASLHSTNSLMLNTANDISPATNQLTVNLGYPLSLRDNYIALANLFVYYSWPNITAAYGNNILSIKWVDGNTYTLTIPDGYYALSDLNNLLQFFMTNNLLYLINGSGSIPVNVYYISLTVNPILYGYTLVVTPLPASLPAGWSYPPGAAWVVNGNTPQLIVPANTVGVSDSSISQILGFPVGSYPATPITTVFEFTSSQAPQISPVTAVNVLCNLVTTSYFNSSPQVIYAFSPNVGYGSQIQITPPYLTYFKCQDAQFNQVSITLVDQDGHALNMLDGNMVAQLYIVDGSPSSGGKLGGNAPATGRGMR